VLSCTICAREWKEKQGGSWGVKMNRKLQQGKWTLIKGASNSSIKIAMI
jgi:hypothetical protein